MSELTLEKLPQQVQSLSQKVDQLYNAVLTQPQVAPADKWLDLDELVNYLPGKPAKATIYAKVSKRKIPHYKEGKELSFLKSEIDEWMKGGKVLTTDEISAAADEQTSKSKNRK